MFLSIQVVKMKNRIIQTAAALMFACMAAMAVGARASALTYKDVSANSWYSEHVSKLADRGVISGYPDMTFKPERVLTRGEFLKLVDRCVGGGAGQTGGSSWASGYLKELIELGIVLPNEIIDSSRSLDANITRFEMAAILVRASDHLGDARKDDPAARYAFTDYRSIPESCASSVAQSYSRGLLNGYPDGRFCGSKPLSRAEAAAVITRLLHPEKRVLPGNGSFAPVAGAVGFMSAAEQRARLFGDSSKTYFSSAAEAGARMTEITVPVWTKNSVGIKVASSLKLVVNKALADDVREIFGLIFNGPQKYCVLTAGGYGWRASLRSEHNRGSAVDINPFANPYVDAGGKIIVGDYYDPADEYSITASSDVVRAFAAYGWGWGGEGRWSSGALDYMHFSLTGT